jgi:hypothetical protein
MSEPIRPRSGMKGTPFSAAWSMVWIAGQVASRTVMRPAFSAAVKRGREAGLAERDGAGLHLRHAAGADQQVGGEAETARRAAAARAPRPHQRAGERDEGRELSGGRASSAPSGTARQGVRGWVMRRSPGRQLLAAGAAGQAVAQVGMRASPITLHGRA